VVIRHAARRGPSLDSLVFADAQPRRAPRDLRAQLAAHRLAAGRAQELCGALRNRPGGAAMTAPRLTPSAACARDSGSGRRFEAADALESIDGGELAIHAASPGRRRRARDRLPGLRATGGQPEMPARGPRRSGLLASSGCLHRPDVPASGGAFAPVHVPRARGCLRQRPAAGGRGGRQRRDLHRIGGRRLSPRSPAVDVPAQAGDDDNLTLGNDAFHVLRDGGGGQGRLPRTRTAVGVHVAMSTPLSTPTSASSRVSGARRRHELRTARAPRSPPGGDGVYASARARAPAVSRSSASGVGGLR